MFDKLFCVEANEPDFLNEVTKIFAERFSELMAETYKPDASIKFSSDRKRRAWENKRLFMDLEPKKHQEMIKKNSGVELTDSDFNNPTNTIRKWRTGRQLPNLYELIKLSAILHCDVDFLIGRTDTRYRNMNEAATALNISCDTFSVIREYPDKYRPLFEALVCSGSMFQILQIIAQYAENPRSVMMDLLSNDIAAPLRLTESQLFEMRTNAAAGLVSNILRSIAKGYKECAAVYPEPDYEKLAEKIRSELARSEYKFDDNGDPIFD